MLTHKLLLSLHEATAVVAGQNPTTDTDLTLEEQILACDLARWIGLPASLLDMLEACVQDRKREEQPNPALLLQLRVSLQLDGAPWLS